MEEIIAPISKEILKAELSEDKRLRFTNKSHNEIYVITHQDSPNVMGSEMCIRDRGDWPVKGNSLSCCRWRNRKGDGYR